MTKKFKIKSLEAADFSYLFALSDQQLEDIGAVRMIADSQYACRVSMEEAAMGEEIIFLNYQHHQNKKSPFRGSGAIVIRKNGKTSNTGVNEIPPTLQTRLLSLRGYGEDGMLKASAVTEGKDLKGQLMKIFENEKVSYIHIHNAKQGCYQALAERV